MTKRTQRAPASPLLRQEIVDGHGMRLADAAVLFPHAGGRPASYQTLWEWADAGLPRPCGGRVYLETLKVGRGLWTSKPAVLRFLEALAAPEEPPAPVPKGRRPRNPDRTEERRAFRV